MSIRTLMGLVLAAGAASCVVAGCASDGGDEPIARGDGDLPADELVSERQLVGSELPDKTLALTFDDGPGQRTTELLTYLTGRGIPATFFINGQHVPGRQGAVDAVVSHGYLLGNHTQRHLQLTKLSSDTVIREVTETDDIIEAVQPAGPWVLRAPYGAWNAQVARTINGTPMKKYVGSVFWDVGGELTASSAADWACWGQGVSIDRCGELYLREIRARRRGIVLMHDIHDKTVDMVKQVIPTLQAEGYHFVRVDEVPSVKRALANGGAAPASPSDCFSSTLGKSMPENSCVQSRRDAKWYRCADGEWAASTGPGDAHCVGTFPLQ